MDAEHADRERLKALSGGHRWLCIHRTEYAGLNAPGAGFLQKVWQNASAPDCVAQDSPLRSINARPCVMAGLDPAIRARCVGHAGA
jgi:hypothetical protein